MSGIRSSTSVPLPMVERIVAASPCWRMRASIESAPRRRRVVRRRSKPRPWSGLSAPRPRGDPAGGPRRRTRTSGTRGGCRAAGKRMLQGSAGRLHAGGEGGELLEFAGGEVVPVFVVSQARRSRRG